MRPGVRPRPPHIVARGLYVQAGDYVMAHRERAATLRAVTGVTREECWRSEQAGSATRLERAAPFVLCTGMRPGWVWVRVIITAADGAVLVDDAVRTRLTPQRAGRPRSAPGAVGGVHVDADGRLHASVP